MMQNIGKNRLAQQLTWQADEHLQQRNVQQGFAQQISNNEIDAESRRQQHLAIFIHGRNSSRETTPDFRSGYRLAMRTCERAKQ